MFKFGMGVGGRKLDPYDAKQQPRREMEGAGPGERDLSDSTSRLTPNRHCGRDIFKFDTAAEPRIAIKRQPGRRLLPCMTEYIILYIQCPCVSGPTQAVGPSS